MADERATVNPIEIARNLREYANRDTVRGTDHGVNDLNAATLIETQMVYIERLIRLGVGLAAVIYNCECVTNERCGWCIAKDKWEEARRG